MRACLATALPERLVEAGEPERDHDADPDATTIFLREHDLSQSRRQRVDAAPHDLVAEGCRLFVGVRWDLDRLPLIGHAPYLHLEVPYVLWLGVQVAPGEGG